MNGTTIILLVIAVAVVFRFFFEGDVNLLSGFNRDWHPCRLLHLFF